MEESLFVKAFGTTPFIRVMDYLIGNMLFDVSLQDICDGTGLARNTVSGVLKNFLELGIAKSTREIGRAKMIALNRENSFVKHLIKLDLELSKEYSDKIIEKAKIAVRA